MNKGLLGKVSLFSVIFLAVILILVFVLPVFSISFIAFSNPTNVNASATNQILNFTIANINTTVNITQVNITLPVGFGFIAVSNTTTETNTIFSNISNKVVWTNTTAAGFLSNGSTQYFSINVSVPSVASAAYNFNVSTLDTTGVYNSTNVTVTVNDTTLPTWSSPSNVTPSSYSPTTLSQFNITWADNVDISTVLIEGNWSNSNASMSNATYGGGIYNYSAVLPAGVWQWRSIANDTKGNVNESSLIIIYIARATPDVKTFIDGAGVNASSPYPSIKTIQGNTSIVLTPPTFNLYVGSIPLGNGTNVSQSISLGVGTYNIVYNTSGNDNWTSAENNSLYVTITPLTSTPSLIITPSNITTYPTTITATGSYMSGDSGANISLYRNGNLVNSSITSSGVSETILLGVGTYNYTVVYAATQNYTTSNRTNITDVGKGSLTGTLSTPNATYPNNLTMTSTESNSGDSDVNYTIYCNSTLVNLSTGLAPTGTYQFGANSSAYLCILNTTSATFTNWTSNSSITTNTTYVNKGNPTSTMNISINGTANDSTVTYPNATNVTGWSTITGQAGLTFNLYKSGAFVNNTTSAPYMIDDENFFGVNTYTYIFNTTGNANYTNGTVTRTLTISQSTPSISLTSSSWSVTYGTATTVTCSVSTPTNETNITLLRNGTIVNSTENGISYTLTVGPWNYTCNSSASTNYSASSASQTLTVNAAATTTTTGGSTGGFTTSTITSTTVRLAQGKVNITADKITTDGKMIANIARYLDVAIRGMNITVVNNVANIKIMTSKLATLPASVPYDINGKVYNYISVSEINITDADIKIVNISFAVNKTWLTSNGVDSSNITLYRWANNKWNDLSASKISEDANEVFFRVSSPGLSVFVIGTKGGAPVITPTPTACTESWSCTDWSTCANSQQTRTCTDTNSCGTTASKPSESQSCTVNKAETTVVTPVQTSILTTIIVIVVAIIACVFIFLERTKISSYLTTITKKSKNNKKTSYLESLAGKVNKVEEEEEEKLNVRTD
jgi:PGF-pre-PGF domain-containing protein